MVSDAASVERPIVFAVPGSLETPTGGYAYDREIVARLPRHGFRPEVLDLGEGFPFPSEAVRVRATDLLVGAAGDHPVVVDGLALGVLPEAAARLAGKRLIALVHHPLAHETGLTPAQAEALRQSERAALAHAQAVVTTSDFTARLLADEYGVPRERITAVRPGHGHAFRAERTAGGDGESTTVRLLCVGSLVPRKGHDVLLAALARLPDLQWRLTIVGAGRDAATAARLRAFASASSLADRIVFAGAVSDAELQQHYADADVFVLASHFEGYGMAFADALTHGLPVVGTNGGAVAEAVPEGAGLLVPPGDVDALADALRRVIADRALREQLGVAAAKAAERLPTWDDAARDFARVIASLA